MDAAIALGVILALLAVTCFWAFRSGRSAASEDSAKAEAKAAFNEAQKWANRPRAPLDVARFLRARAELKREEAKPF